MARFHDLRRSDSALSLGACQLIVLVFWVYISLTAMARWELLRQASSGKGVAAPDLVAMTCLLMYPGLCLLSLLSWQAGYSLARWRMLVGLNLLLAVIFGLSARPLLIVATAMLRPLSIAEATLAMDGSEPRRAAELWASSAIEDAAQYLVLQCILFGAAFYVRLQKEQALRQRLATDFDHARLQLLRSQINPHFLFNTLSAIAGLVRVRPQAAETMITGLGALFRATLMDRDADFVTLHRELDIGVQYLEIQRARFDSRFAYAIALPAAAEQVLIPPLLLQPLLENAAEHGLTAHEGVTRVEVQCEVADGRVQVTVTNRAQAFSGGKPSGARHFGLDNVRGRLSAAFGDTATLTTEHTHAGLFEARLDFPARTLQ
jgi:two-component system, LytTR family, sensor kinase